MQTLHKSKEFLLKDRQWHLINASGRVLGRLASQAAWLLMGKHKPYWSPHLECGDYVIVTNAAKIKLTGNKLRNKGYFKHSGYPGGGKVIPVRKLLEERPERVIELAVKRMLPKTRLARRMITRLKVHAGDSHPHGNHNPKLYDF